MTGRYVTGTVQSRDPRRPMTGRYVTGLVNNMCGRDRVSHVTSVLYTCYTFPHAASSTTNATTTIIVIGEDFNYNEKIARYYVICEPSTTEGEMTAV